MITLVLEHDGRAVGFCAGERSIARKGNLVMLLVEPQFQSRGFGTALLAILERHLCAEGIRDVSVGFGGGENYFWPGVPVAATDAWLFFRKQGWQEQERCTDLLLPLGQYTTPAWVLRRLAGGSTTLRLATPAMSDAIRNFERRHFPKWAAFFESAMSCSKFSDILIAQDATGDVVGTVLLSAEPVVWRQSLGPRCGSLSVLGVRASERGQGIGLALAARSAEILKERGCSACYIGWTGLVDWYGRLGATVWSEYVQATKRLALHARDGTSAIPVADLAASPTQTIARPTTGLRLPKPGRQLHGGTTC